METSNYMEFRLSDLRQNAEKSISVSGVPVMGVVKCDGYGVGLLKAAEIWLSAGADMLGVSLPEEAFLLREGGISADILLMSPVYDVSAASSLIKSDIILTVSSVKCAYIYSKAASFAEKDARVHTAVDAGMGRFGMSWQDIDRLVSLYSIPRLSFEGIFSHFSSAFEKKYRLTKLQLEKFLSAAEGLRARGIEPGIRHIAASCAALRFPETRLDMVRLGSALLGRLPCPAPVFLKPAGTFYAKVVDTKTLCPGDTCGYGSLFKARRRTVAAVAAVGTCDFFGVEKLSDSFCLSGFLRSLLHVLKSVRRRPYALYGGRTLPLIGRPGSQFSLFDTCGADISPGDFIAVPVCILSPGHTKRYI